MITCNCIIPLLTGHSGSLNGPSGLAFGVANSCIRKVGSYFCADKDTIVST